MQNSIFLRAAVLCLAAISPVLLCAQFQQPTPEELQMTSDPKAPGAAAVYLNIEENYELEPWFSNIHARIKVLTEKGEELATVEIPYQKGCQQIARVQGRTIHPDGTVIPLTETPQDLLSEKTHDVRFQRKVFTLPSVLVGSILEYSYEIQDLPCGNYHHLPINSFATWEVQRPYFIHQAHFAYAPADRVSGTDEFGNPLNRLITAQCLPDGVSVKRNALGHFILDVTDVPPTPDEDRMPPLRYLTQQVHFYVVAADDVDDFWTQAHESKTWSNVVDEFATPSKPIKDAVASLMAPGDSDLDKAKKLYAAVQALDNTDFSRKKSEAERRKLKMKDVWYTQDIWKQKSGSGDELALLYLAMLRAAGLTAYAMEVADRDQGLFSPRFTDMDQLDSVLVILKAGDKEIYLDPGEKMCPFGVLSWKHTEAGGIRESAEGQTLGRTPAPPYTQNSTLRTGDLNMDEHGAINGTLRFTMSGQEALYWRQEALENDEAELKKEFDRELEAMVPEGVEAHVNHFLGLNDPGSYLMAMIDVRGTLGAVTANRLVLPGFFLGTREAEPFVHEEKRRIAVDMHYDAIVTDQIIYHLPPGMTVEGAPPDAKTLWKDHAVYNARIHTEPGQITAQRSLARAFTLSNPEEYPDLRGFYQKVAEADQAQLVLTIIPAAKSN